MAASRFALDTSRRLSHGRDVGDRVPRGMPAPPPPPRGMFNGHMSNHPPGHNGGHGGPIHYPPLPHFPGPGGNGGQGGGGQHGWQGLQGIFQMLQGGGINADQLANLGKGYTGGNGYRVGNAHGAFAGLSPYAAHWLASSGILQQAAPQLQDTTGLTGDALFSAQMMNNLAQQGQHNSPYTLHSGITQDMLGQMLGMTQGGGYAKGYNATGRLNPLSGQNFQ